MSFAALQKGMTVFYNEKQTDMVDFMRFIWECAKNPQSEYGIFPPEYYNFITRDEFAKLRTQSGVYAQFARICYSFGNNQTGYLFGSEIEKAKHSAHDIVVFGRGGSITQRRLEFYKQNRMRLQQLERLQQLSGQITFTNLDYRDVKIITPIEEAVVYLDPPYRGTGKYIEGLCHDELDTYFRGLPCMAFMSEYTAPFTSIYQIETRSTLSSTSNVCKKIEKLYINN